MKTKVDKNYTKNVETVKEHLKEFKECYTENDLRLAFYEQTYIEENLVGEIIACTVTGFESSFFGPVVYAVEMTVEYYNEFRKLSFYCDDRLTLDLGTEKLPLFKCEKYVKVA